MTKYVISMGLVLKGYITDWPSELDRAAEKWKSVLESLNDEIIARIKIKLGDGTNITADKYEDLLAAPATEGWKEFVGIPAGNTNPSAVIGQLKHELRVKGGVFKYIANTPAAFNVPSGGKSYFQTRVEATATSDKIKRIFAALQVVGARWVEKSEVPGIIMALTGDGRYMYLIEGGKISGYALAGVTLFPSGTTWDNIKSLVPVIEAQHAHFARPYLISAVVQRFHLAVAVSNMVEAGVISSSDIGTYLKKVNTPFKGFDTFKSSSLSDLAVAYIDPLDSNYQPVSDWSDRKNKAALAICLATGEDDCSDIKDTYLP